MTVDVDKYLKTSSGKSLRFELGLSKIERCIHLTARSLFQHIGLVDIVPHCHLSATLINGEQWRVSRPLTSSICQTAVVTHGAEVLEHEHGHSRHHEQHHEHHDPDVGAEGL